MAEIVLKDRFGEIRKKIKADGKKIVLCHGVFDLVHPGHIQHFKEAKSLGDVLVVSVTAEKYVRKGPGRPYFNDNLRLQTLAAISYIDYVMLSESYTVDDIVKCVQPDLYVKGQEYKKADDDITGKISEEVELVRKYGGDVYYTEGEVFSSTKLINQAFPVFSDELKKYLHEFVLKSSFERIIAFSNRMNDLKILVVGDVIIDDYVFCKVQGLMSKNNAYSARFIREEKYAGGSIAVAKHLSAFCNDVTLMSVIGMDGEYETVDRDDKINTDFVRSYEFKTIVKKRYVEPDEKRRELSKVFVINNITEKMDIDRKAMTEFCNKLNEKIGDYDAVFVCDFGHGLIDEKTKDIIQRKAKVLILNCQTNSSNYGLNLITKYRRADYFSLDEKELRLAYSNYAKSQQQLLKDLSGHLRGVGWLTRGSRGAISIDNNDMVEIPAMTLDVVDTIGAGDAFFAMAGLMAIAGADSEEAAFMGNVAGALASNVVGNRFSLNKVDVLKYTSTLLKR